MFNQNGWKQNTFYLVRVAWGPNNPIHPCIFYSGFLDEHDQPGAYSGFYNPTYGSFEQKSLTYFEIVREVISDEEWQSTAKYIDSTPKS